MIIIGEKINGSIPSIAEAIANRDAELIKERAKIQADCRADFIDCCASVGEETEVETLKWMIECIESVTDVPIALDSPSPYTLRDAIPLVSRPGMVNSVSGEGDKMDVLFPCIAGKDNKWQVVALCSDDEGIPVTSADRLRVFHKIMDQAEKYDIDPSRIHIDPLIEMLATSEDGMAVAEETMKAIRSEYPTIHITGAVSNISFNLPKRKLVNQAFTCLAMKAGLDSAIFDPTNKDLLGMIFATEALMGLDDYCMEYISAYRDELFGPVK